jgi:DnaD/phage-associated family protein
MAGYRQIHTQIWKDEWFIELEPNEKLLFIYLFSNDLASISGLYKIPVRVICNETGLPKEFVVAMLEVFQAVGKTFYQDGVLWIKNMSKYHKNASPFTQQKIAADIANIPDCETKRQYQHCMNTVSTLVSESLSLNESNNKKENENESVTPAAPNIFRLYESEIGSLTGAISDKLIEAEKEYPAEWFPLAFQEAATHNARSWAYAESILKNWKTKGFKTGKNDHNNKLSGIKFDNVETNE